MVLKMVLWLLKLPFRILGFSIELAFAGMGDSRSDAEHYWRAGHPDYRDYPYRHR